MPQVSENAMEKILKCAMKFCEQEESPPEYMPQNEVLHLARICLHVYGGDAEVSGGWVVSDREIHGFRRVIGSYVSELYERNGAFLLAFAGTADVDDVAEDVLQLVGASQQYMTAVENARRLVEALGRNKVFFAGHSLGGGLAQASALATGTRAVTFNPAWLTRETIINNDLDNTAEIINYVVAGEALDVAQRFAKSFKNANWSLPKNYLATSGEFVFLHWPRVRELPEGPMWAHRISAVIESLESCPISSENHTIDGVVKPLLKLVSAVSRSKQSDTHEKKNLWGLASKALIDAVRKKRGMIREAGIEDKCNEKPC